MLNPNLCFTRFVKSYPLSSFPLLSSARIATSKKHLSILRRIFLSKDSSNKSVSKVLGAELAVCSCVLDKELVWELRFDLEFGFSIGVSFLSLERMYGPLCYKIFGFIRA